MNLESLVELIDMVKALLSDNPSDGKRVTISDYGFDEDGKTVYVTLSNSSVYYFTMKG